MQEFTQQPGTEIDYCNAEIVFIVKDLMDLSGRNKLNVLKKNQPLWDLIEMLSHPDVHRVAVVNENHEWIGLVTQTRLLRFISANKDKLKEKMQNSAITVKLQVIQDEFSQNL